MDGSRPGALVKAFLPKAPFILQSAASHTLGLSHTSSKWDLRTELTVKIIRSFLTGPKPSPISKQQQISLRDPGIKGPLWISKIAVPKPAEDDVLKQLEVAIDALKSGEERYTLPEAVSVEAEWTGHRAGVGKSQARLDLSEEQHYDRLMAEVASDVTILYLHGGAYYLLDPCSHRPHCSKVAKLTGGRCLSVRYRLAPQNPFPAALLDALVSYLYLLSPPPGSFHRPVPASHIVIAGDSAGAGLSMALLQLILQLHRASPSTTPTIRIHGQDVAVALPAGLALHSAWLDLTQCMPSIHDNLMYDYLPKPLTNGARASYPSCRIWPTEPPRGDVYCDTSMICHPLVSPLAARDWRGACPVWFSYGTELLADEGKATARRIARQGGTVVWREYEAMPHCFALIFEHLAASARCVESCARFCADVVAGTRPVTNGSFARAKSLTTTAVDVAALLDGIDDAAVERRMRQTMGTRWRGPAAEVVAVPKL